MFLTAVKVAIVESLNSVWYPGGLPGDEHNEVNPALDSNPKEPIPRTITLEYPEKAVEWPCVLVQVRPTLVEWTGITPDEVVDATLESGHPDVDYTTTDDPEPNPNPTYRLIRQGRFEGTCMLQVLASTSMERDRIWDNLIKVIMMGRKKSATAAFFETFENHDLIGVSIMEGSIRPIGDSIGPGTPWDPEQLSYEAALEFDMVGVFFADEYTEELVPLESAEAFEYIAWEGNEGTIGADANEEPPGENDGQGAWRDPYTD